MTNPPRRPSPHRCGTHNDEAECFRTGETNSSHASSSPGPAQRPAHLFKVTNIYLFCVELFSVLLVLSVVDSMNGNAPFACRNPLESQSLCSIDDAHANATATMAVGRYSASLRQESFAVRGRPILIKARPKQGHRFVAKAAALIPLLRYPRPARRPP